MPNPMERMWENVRKNALIALQDKLRQLIKEVSYSDAVFLVKAEVAECEKCGCTAKEIREAAEAVMEET